jgi:hypothetical protein
LSAADKESCDACGWRPVAVTVHDRALCADYYPAYASRWCARPTTERGSAMNKIVLDAALRTALAIVARLPWDRVLEILKAVAVRRLNILVLEQIDRLVLEVDSLDMKGYMKRQQVIAVLLADGSPVRMHAEAAPGWLLGWAIDTAVLRLRTAES